MHFEEWDWEKEGRDVNEYLRSKESEEWLSEFFKTTTPEDLDSIVKKINGSKKTFPKPKRKKADDNRIHTLMDKYDLSCEYVIEEFIVDNDIIDPDKEV